MTTITYHSIDGTEAALGVAGGHSVIADRPEGKTGGQGLGFNGGELLALAIGGCFANDLRAMAHQLGRKLGRLSVTVALEFGGEPGTPARRVVSARMTPTCEMLDGSDPADLIEQTSRVSVIRNSVQAGFPVAMG
ncbi:MAG: OsmC family peroxiredoxin [Alphaproteobacteria bacterium]|nr:OsmC family peroxiredoxin [Alphaproteobacteria bacterium]